MHSDASARDPIARPRRTILVRHSTMKVSSAMRATNPSMLRDPKRPWMGPSCARSPWMPRIVIGTSSRMPESTSSASETPEQHPHDVAERPHDLDRVAHEGDVDADEGERDQVDHAHGGPEPGALLQSTDAAHQPDEDEDRDRQDAVPLHGAPPGDEREHAQREQGGERREQPGPADEAPHGVDREREPHREQRERLREPRGAREVAQGAGEVPAAVGIRHRRPPGWSRRPSAARHPAVIASPRAAASGTRGWATARRAGARPPTAAASSTRRSR